jgi:hypothetical protein
MTSINLRTNLKYLALMTGVMLGVWSFVGGVLQGLLGLVDPATFSVAQTLAPLVPLFFVCLLNVSVVIWFVNRSYLDGLKLAAVVFLIVFGVMFFMTQIETTYFNHSVQMPWPVILSTVVTGLVVGAVVAWLSVRLKWQLSLPALSGVQSGEAQENWVSVVWKFAVLALAYVVLYFGFGYFIAWQFPKLREFYSGSREILPFFTHMRGQLSTDPWLVVFQVFRGVLWTAIGYCVTRGVAGIKGWERLCLVGCALSIGLATPLFLPNEYMPGGVRLGHFFESLAQNFPLGVLVALLFQETAGSVAPMQREALVSQ